MNGESQIKILVVGQDKDLRGALSSLLKDEGYGTIEAQDGQSAFKSIVSNWERTGEPGVHLVIVDTSLPSDDALVLLQELRATGISRLPLLVVSGVVSYEDVEMVALQKPAAILLKPFGRDVLLAKMGQLLGVIAATA